jgi:FkbM family methyltransferase
MTERYAKTFSALQSMDHRVRALHRIRPGALAIPFFKWLLPSQRRGIVMVDGVGKLYLDPVSHLGRTILTTNAYEPETIAILHQHLKAGYVFFDIGANEGVMSACAATLVGSQGCVVAVEPQSRLVDVLEINLALNSTGKYHIVHGAVSDRDGDQISISLQPEGNTGGSSLVHKYRWSSKTEQISTYTVETLARSFGIDRIDLVKVDVEGYEPEVARALHRMLDERRIGKLLIDYHAPILKERGISSESVHQGIVGRGYQAILGSPAAGYVLYGQS